MRPIQSVLIITILLVGCAGLPPAPLATMAQLPTVRVGDPIPPDTAYIVFYPAGYEFPVKLSASGSLFSSPVAVEGKAALARDLYLYKHWASHDGKIWLSSHDLLGVEFGGGFDAQGLQANIELHAQQ